MTQTGVAIFTQQDWDVYARCYDTLLKLKPYKQLIAVVSKSVAIEETDVFLDAGCGTGNLLHAVRRGAYTAILHGVDLSPSMLSRADVKNHNKPHTFLHHASLDEVLPFSGETFTKVASMNVLYAVPNPLRTLCELYRVMKYGATLTLVTPKKGYDNGFILKEHCNSPHEDSYWQNAHASPEREEKLIREVIKDEKSIQDMLLVARHNRAIAKNMKFSFFTASELAVLVEQAGFSITSIEQTYAQQGLLLKATKG